jgi:hypothetical protein
MGNTKNVFIHNDGIKIEAEYYESNNKNRPAVLTTHPHPQMGGSMHNNVTSAIFTKFKNEDISCMRFNFRGVGRSTGSYTGGKGEIKDVEACLDFLLNEENHQKVLICGYSFGAAIGCSAVDYSDKVIGFVAISFPWDFMGKKYKKLSQTEKPKLFVQGDRDNIASYEKFKNHVEDYPEPKTYEIISGADHFYRGYEQKITEIVFPFYKSLIK